MGFINDISKLNSGINKSSGKKIKNKSGTISVSEKNNRTRLKSSKDLAEISDESIKLFKLQKESSQYIDLIKNVHLVSEKQLHELRENVLSDFYSQDEIVDAITDKVLSLSNYKN